MVNMANAKETYLQSVRILQKANMDDAKLESDLLFSFVVGKSRFLVDEIEPQQEKKILDLTLKRAQHYPLQYLLEKWEFMGLELFVGEGVLIPRPETEEVCEMALSCIKEKQNPLVYDLCAGTGALALGIQKIKKDAQVTAVEVSPKAFTYLEKNCAYYKEQWGKAPNPVQDDIFSFVCHLEGGIADLIVSNPPYVTTEEYQELEPELYFEPKLALVEETDGLLFYRKIAEQYQTILKKGGSLVFEIGAKQGEAVHNILQALAYSEIEIVQDLSGTDRIVKAIR